MKIKYKRTERRFFTTQCWEEKRVLSMSDLLLVIVPSRIATICPGQLSVTLLMVNIGLGWAGPGSDSGQAVFSPETTDRF